MVPLKHLQPGTSFCYDTPDLEDITLDYAWLGPNSTLFIHFHTFKDCMTTLLAKRRLTSLPPSQRFFLDLDLMKSQRKELKLSIDQVVVAREEGKQTIIWDLKAIIQDSNPQGYSRPWAKWWSLSDGGHDRGHNTTISIGCWNYNDFCLPQACSIMQLGSTTSFSLQRHMQVLCGAHPRFIGTTGHGHVNMIQGPKMLEAQGVWCVLYKTPSRAKSCWFLQMSMPDFCGSKSISVTPYTLG